MTISRKNISSERDPGAELQVQIAFESVPSIVFACF